MCGEDGQGGGQVLWSVHRGRGHSGNGVKGWLEKCRDTLQEAPVGARKEN